MSYKVDKDNKSFCLAPWMAIHVWPDGKTFPCCLWDIKDPIGNINENTLEEIWNNDQMKKVRTDMLQGKELKACDRCNQLNASGYNSYRDSINKRHPKTMKYVEETDKDGFLPTMNLHLWDFRLSNFCNFKCRSCGVGLSSTWHSDTLALSQNAELKEFGSSMYNTSVEEKALISINDKVKFLDLVEKHYSCVDEIYFAGGEPLMMPEHYAILDKLLEIDRTDVIIRYSTNFSVLKFKGKSIFDYWKHFEPNLELWISIDGVGKIGEYVRKGFNDKKFEENITALKKSGLHFPDVGYMVTYGNLNFLHLFDMAIDFIKREYVDYLEPFQGNKLMYFSPISFPRYYDSRYLPNKFKQQFLNRLQNFTHELIEVGAPPLYINDIMVKLTQVYNRSLEKDFDSKEMEECRVLTLELDKLRSEKFEDTFGYFTSVDDLIDNTDAQPLVKYDYIPLPLELE